MTRRPSVPKAQFTDGISTDRPTRKKDAAGSAKAEKPNERAPEVAGAGGKDGKKGKRGRGSSVATKERRPASAPAARSADDGVHDVDHSPVPARSFSGRLLVLGLAMGAVTLLLAPNVHTYLQQRAEISALREDIAVRVAEQDDYTSELARWDDPAYIKQQARDRVSMLMPGETGYWVYGGEELGAGEDGALAGSGSTTKDPKDTAISAKDATNITVQPWVDSLVEAVRESGQVQAQPAVPGTESTVPGTSPSLVPDTVPGTESTVPGTSPSPVPEMPSPDSVPELEAPAAPVPVQP